MTDIIKSELRKKAKQMRAQADAQEKLLRDKAIYERIISLNEYKNAETVFVYCALKGEVDTDGIISHALENGKTVAVPRCIANTSLMEFYEIKSLSELETGAYGIREPSNSGKPINDADICIVPALMFDNRGYRLGYGKGYYDRFLKDKKCVRIGVCHDCFVADELVHDIYDVRVQLVVTEKRMIKTYEA